MNDTVSRFLNSINKLNAKEYMFNIITYEIAPTLCGKKSASLIALTKANKDMYDLWEMNKMEFLRRIPLKYFEFNNTGDTVTVLFYNEDKLKELLVDIDCINFLKDYGYSGDITTVYGCLCKLKERFSVCFPHEIGLFLDIPLEDVRGFVKNSGKDYKYCGYWKVYSDVENTIKKFESYSKIKKWVTDLATMDTNFVHIIDFLCKYGDA